MKKCFTHILPLMFIATSLIACGSNSVPTSTSKSIEEIVPLDSSEDFAEGSMTGFFEEIAVGRFLAVGDTYNCYFVPSSTVKTYTVEVSHPDILEVTHEDGYGITLKGLKPGDSYIEVTTTDDMLVLRQTVRIRQKYSPEEINKAVFNNDLYHNGSQFFDFLGEYRVNSISTSNPIEIMVSGKDEVDKNVDCVCELSYEGYYAPFDAYAYSVKMTEKNERQKTDINFAYITTTADTIYLYYNPGDGSGALLTWVWPQKYDSIRNF